MDRRAFFESGAFTSMGKAYQKELIRVLDQASKFEEATGQALEDGFTREQYITLFDFMKVRRADKLYRNKVLLRKYVEYLIDSDILEPDQQIILSSISIEDLSPISYFKNIDALCEAITDSIRAADCYDMTVYDGAAAVLFLSWYGLTKAEISDYRIADVHDDGIMIRGEKITPPLRVMDYFISMRDSDGFYQVARGVMFSKYKTSEYLIRTRANEHIDQANLEKMVGRMNQIMGGKYNLKMDTVRQSGIFYRAYQEECQNNSFDLDDPEFASKVFCEDFSLERDKYGRQKNMRIKEYEQYKKLFH